jgi:CHAT domain-containing protein
MAVFYAGASALLVSHWAVNSSATVQLITRTFDEIKIDQKIWRAEALHRSMLALTAKGGVNAHPSNWAPFIVVGEGGR